MLLPVLIAVSINIIGMLLIYSLMAYALTRLCWGRGGMIPVFLTIVLAQFFWIVPEVAVGFYAKYWSFYGNTGIGDPAGLYLRLCNWLVSAFGVVILCQAARQIPQQLEDSARLDGCGWLRIYWHILLPLVRPQLMLIALLTLMATTLSSWAILQSPDCDPARAAVDPISAWVHLPQDNVNILLVSPLMSLLVIAIFLLAKRFQTPSLLESHRHPLL